MRKLNTCPKEKAESSKRGNGSSKISIKDAPTKGNTSMRNALLQGLKPEPPLGAWAIVYNKQYIHTEGYVSRFDSKEEAIDSLLWSIEYDMWSEADCEKDQHGKDTCKKIGVPSGEEIKLELSKLLKEGIIKVVKV